MTPKKPSIRPTDHQGSTPIAHSEKPAAWMQTWLPRWVPDGGLVGELYAGESAALARACRADGRVAYVGAELDEVRHAAALARLAAEVSS